MSPAPAEDLPAPLAVITLSEDGAQIGTRLAEDLSTVLFVHAEAIASTGSNVVPGRIESFERVADLTARIFRQYQGLIFIMPTGVVVRSIAPLLESKLSDPAVVVLDVHARYAISLLCGHEGGANALTVRVANLTGAEPVVTTTTDARKDIIAGIGCRKDTPARAIVSALQQALAQTGVKAEAVRLLATAGIKAAEPGLLEAARELNIPLRIISNDDIRNCPFTLEESTFVREKVGLPGVCEPAALLAGRRARFILKKTAFNGVTIALAREERCG